MGILRVHYRERQRLNAADMRVEQDYRLGLGGRHDLAHHSWGIVRGLRIVPGAGGGFLLTPGIAIDGHGREIFVARPLAVDVAGVDQKLCWYVQLYYCEDALDPSAGKPCGNQPAPRIGPRPVVAVARSFAPPTPSLDDLARARAAGIEGLEPWPVLVATCGMGCNANGQLIDYTLTRYARHQAAMVRAPNGRALMQLGLTSRMDFYHFLLSTRDGASALAKRIGVDRHDTVHFWRPLYIAASKAAATVDIGHQLQLRIVAPMPAGLGSRVRIEGEVDATLNTLKTSLRVSGAPFAGSDAHTALKRESAALSFPDAGTGAVRLFDAVKRTSISFAIGRKRMDRGSEKATAFSAQADPADARLVLKNVEHGAAAADSPCDIGRTRSGNGASDLSALLFRPAKELVADPLAREIHAIDISKPADAVPATELRISGGAGDDTDAATRVSIGAKIRDGYQAGIRMDGGRRVAIVGLPGQAGVPVLTVDRTVYLPPIGAKDPLLPELLVLAYIGGLRRIGNVTTSITVTLSPPAPAPGATLLGTPLSYHINMQPAPGANVTIKRVMELVTGEHGKGDLTFRALPLPAATATTAAGTGNIALPELRRVEHKAEVVVLMLVEIAQKVRVVVSNALVIDLDNPPH